MESDSKISLGDIVFTASHCAGAARSKATSLFVQLGLWAQECKLHTWQWLDCQLNGV